MTSGQMWPKLKLHRDHFAVQNTLPCSVALIVEAGKDKRSRIMDLKTYLAVTVLNQLALHRARGGLSFLGVAVNSIQGM
jgi:hypothetical protein